MAQQRVIFAQVTAATKGLNDFSIQTLYVVVNAIDPCLPFFWLLFLLFKSFCGSWWFVFLSLASNPGQF